MMNSNYEIAGLVIFNIKANKINDTPIPISKNTAGDDEVVNSSNFARFEAPMVRVETILNLNVNAYRVGIFLFIPHKLNKITEVSNSLFPVLGDTIYIKYNGVYLENTSIDKAGNGCVTARDFLVVYDAESQDFCNAYYLEFEYFLENPNLESAETVQVKNRNIDPRTSRGTIATSSTPKSSN